MHLDRKRARLGLALPLTACALPQTRQILLAYGHVASRVAGTNVIYQDLEVHLRLAAQTLHVGLKMTLIGSDGAAQRVVVLERGAKAKGKYSRQFETICYNPGVILSRLLIHPCTVFRAVLGDDDSQIAGGKKESLITEHARDPGQRHRAAVPAKFRKCQSFCNAIGVPCHMFILPMRAERSNCPFRKLVMKLKPIRILVGSCSCN